MPLAVSVTLLFAPSAMTTGQVRSGISVQGQVTCAIRGDGGISIAIAHLVDGRVELDVACAVRCNNDVAVGRRSNTVAVYVKVAAQLWRGVIYSVKGGGSLVRNQRHFATERCRQNACVNVTGTVLNQVHLVLSLG